MRVLLDELLEQLERKPFKGSSSSKSHLKQALYDWRVEQQWSNENAYVLHIDYKAFSFITFTKRDPRHCCIRHLFVLEEHRGKGIGKNLIEEIKRVCIESDVRILRFFANKPAIGFYEKIGYKWHGKSKTGLPFFYGTLDGDLIELPKSQLRYLGTPIK